MSVDKGPGNHRVEKGQPISHAFTAMGWNRAQDAADIVLGVTNNKVAPPAVPYKYGFVLPIELDETADQVYEVGTAVKITGYLAMDDADDDGNAGQGDKTILRHLKGEVATARELNDFETQAVVFPEPFGVCSQPIREGDDVAQVVVSGVAVARVRFISSLHRYVCLPSKRGDDETDAGVLETSDTGYARAITVGLEINDRPEGHRCLIIL